MPYSEKLTSRSKENQARVIHAYSKFLDLILSEIQKHGLDYILQLKGDVKHEHYWIYKHYERILDFSEAIQLKTIPQQVDANVNQVVTMGEIKKDDQPLRFNLGSDLTQDTGYSGQALSSN